MNESAPPRSGGADGPLADSVSEHRDALEAWADSDLPLAEDMAALLDTVDGEG